MKKILALVLALTTIFALAVSAMAADTFIEEAGFHCNDGNGNGSVSPPIPVAYQTFDNNGKVVYVYPVNRVNNTTSWELDDSDGKNAIVCPACGRTDWVTYSNNSGVPDGKNAQFKHLPVKPEPKPEPTKQVNIKVIYYLSIPKCTATCKYAPGPCDFKCVCVPCKYEANFKSHICTLECFGSTHDANCRVMNFKKCDPNKKCKCAKEYNKVIINETHLIPISASHNFKHTAPAKWNGGTIVAGTNRVINETLTADKTYEFFYKGTGKCKCRCLEPVCKIECKPCTFKPTCDHKGIVCDNCKNGNGNNHKNCEFDNPNATSNYFCMTCTKKVGALKWDKKTTLYSWEPADKGENAWSPAKPAPYLPICECTTCNKK